MPDLPHQRSCQPALFSNRLIRSARSCRCDQLHFSKSREDGVFNPKPIPSLSDRNAHTVSRDQTTQELPVFLHSLIEQEFAGFEPQPLIFESVLAYLGALDDTACVDGIAISKQGLEPALKQLDLALNGAQYAIEHKNDPKSAQFLLTSAQVQIGEIATRYNMPQHKALQVDLGKASAALRKRKLNLQKGKTVDQIQVWRKNWQRTEKELRIEEANSLYQYDRLQEYLQSD